MLRAMYNFIVCLMYSISCQRYVGFVFFAMPIIVGARVTYFSLCSNE